MFNSTHAQPPGRSARVACVAAFALALAVGWTGSAQAVPTGVPDLQVSFAWEATDDPNSFGSLPTISGSGLGEVSDLGNGDYNFNGSYTGPVADVTWDVSANADPFVNQVFGFTNTTGATQTFTLTVVMPIFPTIPGASLMGGSTGGSVTDANASGAASAATVGSALYSALIDGGVVWTLHNDPISFDVVTLGGTVNIPAVAFGTPIPSQPGPPVASTIGIETKFSLTAGDSITLSSFFLVEAVPEPAVPLLLGIALSALALHRRA